MKFEYCRRETFATMTGPFQLVLWKRGAFGTRDVFGFLVVVASDLASGELLGTG